MLRDTIAQCKLRLPMPELWARLRLKVPRNFKSFSSPFREDKTPSFSVFQVGKLWFYKDQATSESGDEIGLIQRHSGCDKDEAIKTYHDLAGVEMPRKAAPRGSDRKDWGKIVKVYDYKKLIDGEWRLWHQTLRYAPKRFLQRRPAGPGMRAGNKEARRDPSGNWWVWTLEGIEPVLYRLQELTEHPDKTVVICEGEKDADALAEREPRFVTTTAPMGAGKWRPSYTEALRGRNVIVVGQWDTVGQQYVLKVANDLTGVAATVRRLIWNKLVPSVIDGQKIDIYDFLAGTTAGCSA
jgi:DNA primase